MRNIMKKALCAAFLALTFCGRAFAEPAGTVTLSQSMQTRKLIVNLVVVAAVLLVYYGKKMKMYRTGDVKANIAAYMAQKNYGKRESCRDRVRRMNSGIRASGNPSISALSTQAFTTVMAVGCARPTSSQAITISRRQMD